MVASAEKLVVASTVANQSDRVAVMLMGYGEVESYEDFAK